jgi:HSP20 family molecular chaperone IbpA
MERMQEEIDRAIHDATEQFRLGPGATAFQPDASYSSSFNLRDRKDHYELRAYLPDVNASDVNVRVDNDRTPRVSVTQRKQQKRDTTNGSESFTEFGQYEQVVTLAEPVKSSEMKIERSGHEMWSRFQNQIRQKRTRSKQKRGAPPRFDLSSRHVHPLARNTVD